MSDLTERRAELKAKELALHDAYIASEPGSQEERALELALEGIMAELDAQWDAASVRML